jgi:hypothetical protein
VLHRRNPETHTEQFNAFAWFGVDGYLYGTE